jgi:hypothetical protein
MVFNAIFSNFSVISWMSVCFVGRAMLPFLIGFSVFSNVYLPVSLDCPFLIANRYPLTFICKFKMDNPEKLANKR